MHIFLFLLGVAVATQLNRGIYRLAWFARPIGPWSAAHEAALPRHWSDRIPIVGWIGEHIDPRAPLLLGGIPALAAAGYGWTQLDRDDHSVDVEVVPERLAQSAS